MAARFLLLSLGACAVGVNAKTALLIIDVQDCFLPASVTTSKADGSLAVPGAAIIPLINQIRSNKSCLFDEVIRSQDFHPAKHISFGSTHGLAPFSHLNGQGGLPLKCIKPTTGNTADASCCPAYHINNMDRTNCATELCPPAGWKYADSMPSLITNNKACTECKTNASACMDMVQAMWTDHCLQSGDAGFPPTLQNKATDVIVQKGMNGFVDAYSAFMDNTKNFKTTLDATLQAKGITELYVVGIATDVCVAATVADAFNSKTGTYKVTVIKDATAAVMGDQASGIAAFDKAIVDMKAAGATIVMTADVLKMACPAVPAVTAGARESFVAAALFSLLMRIF